MRPNNKLTVRRGFAALLAVIMLVSVLCTSVFAETAGETYAIPETNMSVTLPEGVKMISIDTYFDDPIWLELGILDPATKGNEMINGNVLAEIYACDGECVISVTKKESDFSRSLYNLNNLAEENKAEFLEGLVPRTADQTTTGTANWYEHPQIPFFCVDIQSSSLSDDGTVVYERLYGTMFDGIIVSFDLYNGDEPISEEYDSVMRQVVDSAVFSEFAEKPGFIANDASVMALGIIVLLFVLLIAYIIFTSIRRKHDKAARREMAEKLAAFRRSRKDDVSDGELRFLNETVHDDEAIRTFAKYQAFHGKSLFIPIFTVALALAAVSVVMQYDTSDNWWLILALVACVGFSLYKSATAGTEIEKSLIRVFSAMRSRKATFCFYDDEFRIGGIQASTLYPYFQVTKMAETKDYFYLYMGEGTTYYIKKDRFKGFENGDGSDEFRAFMKEKLEGRFH